uniref:gliding motility-associated C-terminal domain-containing protein n=1 Tax=uncultured Tenacibaculum sp. TaxID=174713 RepID=UPI00261026F5
EHVQTLTIEDTTAPTFVETLPEDATVSCDAIPEAVVLTATDNCDAQVTVNYSESLSGNDDECPSVYTITRTWSVSDCAGNTTEHVQTLTIEDTTAPTFVETLPEDATVSCDTIPEAVVLTATDNCDAQVSVNYSESLSGNDDECPSVYTITRTWSVSDCAGNTAEHVQTLTIEDTTAPTFVETLPEDATVSCDTIPEAVVLTATDNCDAQVTVNYSESLSGNDDECPSVYTITRTWSVSDCAGNTAEHVQTLTIEDTTAPTFVETLPEDATVSCDAIPEVVVLTATDNCDAQVTVNYSESLSGNDDECPSVYTITRTWSVSDCAGNTTEHVQTLTIEDTTAPTFVETLPEDATVSCDAIPEAVVLTATDNCDAQVTVNYSESLSGNDDECPSVYTITRTWSVSDCAGNTTEHVQTLTIEDTTAPTFVEALPEDTTVSCDTIPEAVVLTATDNCDTQVTVNYNESLSGNDDECPSVYTITRTWSVSDCAGNTTEHVQTLTIEDTTAPTFVETLPEDATVSCDAIPEAVVLTATDNCDAQVTVNYSESLSGNDDECPSVYTITRTWSVSDCAGNTTEHVQTLTIEDTTAPTLVETLPEDTTVSCDAIPEAVVLTATDNCDAQVTVNYSESLSGNDDECPSVYTIIRTWSVSDCAGNTTEHVQTINVEDTTAPTFVETLPEDATVSCDAIPEAVVLTGADNCDSQVTVVYNEVVGTSAEGCASSYTITRTWMVSDCAGNETSHEQVITVEDTEGPTLVSSLDDEINVECDAIPDIPELEFEDNCSENVTEVSFEETSTFDGTDTDYSITRVWIVRDDCGNTSEFTQVINVSTNNTTIEVSDSKCIDDGIVDLNDYLDTSSTDVTWEVISGNIELNSDGTFDPQNLELGDYVFSYTAPNQGCLATTRVTININDDCVVLPCGQEDVVISKAVTPNGDQWNENFEVTGVESCGFIVKVQIFNRWGSKVYESNNYANNWNGITDGASFGGATRLPAGTYYYIVELENSGLRPFTGAIYLGTK